MRKFLKQINIIQTRGPLARLNPYNPLSYLTIILAVFIGLFMFGFVGIKEEMQSTNPFKWN